MKWQCLLLTGVLALNACTSKPQDAPARIEVWKSPSCKCCSKWVEYLEREGFDVAVRNEAAMSSMKAKFGVPSAMASCHTGVVNGYVIEGHVPADDIRKLLADKPAARGLAVPGMPIGSPGMEWGDRKDPYETMLIAADGSVQPYARHGTRQPAQTAP